MKNRKLVIILMIIGSAFLTALPVMAEESVELKIKAENGHKR